MNNDNLPPPNPLNAYLGDLFWTEDTALGGLVADLKERGPQIQVGPQSGRLLQVLLAAVGAHRVVEVGTLFGYSAVWMARSLPPDPVGHLDTIEINDMHADAAEQHLREAGLSDRVTVHRGSALEVITRLDGPYDAFFMDAVKAEYPAYLDQALRLVRPGGLILADNVHWSGRVADPLVTDADTEGLREYLRRIGSDPQLLSTVVAAGDGLAVSVVRASG